MGFVAQNKHDKMALRIFNQNSLLFRPFPSTPPRGADVRHTQTPSFCQLTLYIGAGRPAHRGER